MAKKKEPEKTVRFEVYKPFVPPHEGEYFQLLVYKGPEYPQTLILGRLDPNWQVVKEAGDVLDLVEEHNKQRKVYAKVQIRQVDRKVIVGAE